MAADKKWKDSEFQEALKNKPYGEKQYDMVSKLYRSSFGYSGSTKKTEPILTRRLW